MEKPIKPNRRERRLLLRRGKRGEEFTTYVDNMGNEFDYKIAAKLSSFLNIMWGCTKRGFPIVVPYLRYDAWAFYPFFFVKSGVKRDFQNSLTLINHERIHVVQQRDIHVTISLPLIIVSCLAEAFGWFNPFYLLCFVPFVPTILYGLEMIRSYHNLVVRNTTNDISDDFDSATTFEKVRANTCFEREAISRSTNLDYLIGRKFWAVADYF